ncbi:MAG: outer membrane protein assembly factor BamD [Zymomonas mobilis subsp. pomaceae]|uniref:Outer membrane protein assembly factor BamD n=1 Tax=Zymomonas mobilis subsp. pomaceae (strain ATCC 29192 / DSM 22645 / JCM 10191 / CCUG 17912 / NBRC 13757 / NCIMB 11200 / NRRL B-4491 / Barker I) TaxID=579138 RepID=F8EV35_ZYMMT|nr:outer membrane protein assembly factor BamD [Zymomonas mobilis]AEI38253.1 outer membrane assembly lipoprotein YfiO [Zymomonas mobilis subsp. pomaceae ATCC 29192]MDX5947942.1 outer membrane protein assembly factor BamD [Zymomonas mobilis subsp. pomaceae]GEB89271.1 outer membrane protein assembly factor BamD [Zymomonas mobilis subsp. pomaceae]
MASRFSRSLVIALTAIAVLPMAGCTGRGKKKTDTRYVARDVDTLYNAAKQSLANDQYKAAAGFFDEVERQHPYSIWARRAQLMSAFCNYRARNYTASIASAQRFLAVHTGNKDAPYAMYLIMMDYYEQIQDVNHDQHITQQALDSMNELIRRYPDSSYAADARLKIDLVHDHLGGKEMAIGRFYEQNHLWLAATLRFRRVIDEYQTTTYVPEALERLTESYLALGLRSEARNAAAVLGANFPGSKWYSRAYHLIREHYPQAFTQVHLQDPEETDMPEKAASEDSDHPKVPAASPENSDKLTVPAEDVGTHED